MFAIIAAALAITSADPTTTTMKTTEPVQAVCSIKFPTKSDPVQVPCVAVAMSEDNMTGVAFVFDAESSVIFVGNANEGGVKVEVVMIGEKPFSAEGVCVAEPGKIACVAAPPGAASPLVVLAEY